MSDLEFLLILCQSSLHFLQHELLILAQQNIGTVGHNLRRCLDFLNLLYFLLSLLLMLLTVDFDVPIAYFQFLFHFSD